MPTRLRTPTERPGTGPAATPPWPPVTNERVAPPDPIGPRRGHATARKPVRQPPGARAAARRARGCVHSREHSQSGRDLIMPRLEPVGQPQLATQRISRLINGKARLVRCNLEQQTVGRVEVDAA